MQFIFVAASWHGDFAAQQLCKVDFVRRHETGDGQGEGALHVLEVCGL